ncbi:hypothetical protein AMK01_PD00554 (plasmid) [Rhizobium sp. N6212]|nr:hypothetical protein AMK01_PD00554 [Rhizobium sp. N6212]ANL01486.1 hypothetical protein AMK00_PD00553 [Rhizobium sp. N621]ANL07609.1 hypothetical protein AMJ99_PD00555 [Rhizobium esperanzae]ANL13779.1 hypothetical protein AMJ98_PE00555 [Rhizobium sp. N1341]ANL25763.1 hypothetical protein AMJ96_PD00562 [Rhizobium sp. N113]ANM38450.1 hypothetical protein AMK04_PD00556 [Rhizobium sp. N871]ANM44604.1 hypothetical protein AMK03_PE00556 [Rhizobium sp. N741]
MNKLLSAGSSSDGPSPRWKFPLLGNRRSLRRSALLVLALVVATIAVSYIDIRRSEAPTEDFENRAPNKAAPSARLAVRSDPAASSPRPTISISRHLMELPKLDLASQFLRMWLVSGANICGALREAGIEVSEWKAASMRNRDYECYFQRIYERDEARPLSSTFLRVRGDGTGNIVEIRAKIVGPKIDAEGLLAPEVLRIFEIIVKQACWRDFEDALASIQSLRDVEAERFGSYLSFTREAGSENRFSFALGLKAAPGSQARTRAYFSADRWLATTDARIPRTSSASIATARSDQPMALNGGASAGSDPKPSRNCG